MIPSEHSELADVIYDFLYRRLQDYNIHGQDGVAALSVDLAEEIIGKIYVDADCRTDGK